MAAQEGTDEEPAQGETPAAPAYVTCSVCGITAPELPPTWSLQVGARGAQHVCDTCTRQNLRSIEGRLDEAWW